ncbi:hypothetical protein BDY24DRAFT_236514 [Mrakia frigida]|uniref:uncharacterized protein n=1 Tax=Mrakia frigida TaxID=29902 RepID=UPI003FCC26DA
MENDSPLGTPKLTASPGTHSVEHSRFFPCTPFVDRNFAPSLPASPTSPIVFLPLPSNSPSDLASSRTSLFVPVHLNSSLALDPPIGIAAETASVVERNPSFNARLAPHIAASPRPTLAFLQTIPTFASLPNRLSLKGSLTSGPPSPNPSQGTFGPISRSRESTVSLLASSAPAPWTRMDPSEVNRHSLVTINSPRDKSLFEAAEYEMEEKKEGRVEGGAVVELSVV